MDRKSYNACMSPFIRGKKTKEERQQSFCIGAKVCSGKAKDEKEAEYLCSLPKEPKLPKAPKKSVKQVQTEQDACNLSQFQEIISQFKNVYVDVNSPRCAPCRELDGLIKEAEIPWPIVQVPENCLEIVDHLGIESFPTVVYLQKGKVVTRHTMGPQDTIEKMKKGQ